MFKHDQRNSMDKLCGCLSLFALIALPLSGSADIRFTDVTQQFQVRGYSYFGGHGISWVDANRDGRLDIFVKNQGAQGIAAVPDILYINYGTFFTDEATARGVADAYPVGTHGAVFADYDRDGDFDLFCSATYGSVSPSHNHLYRNDGNGFFQDMTSSAFVPPQSVDYNTRGVAAADFDKDGDLDFYISDPLANPDANNPLPSPPQSLPNFFINNGDGTFTAEYRGINWTGFVQGVAAVDVDGDGDIDIAEAKWAPPTTIYLNDGTGNFHDVGGAWGLPTTITVWDRGISFGDVDNDGDLDLAIGGENRLALYKYTNKHYQHYQDVFGPRDRVFCASFGDFDNDGYLELYISGEGVYENDGQGNFTPVPVAESGLENSLTVRDPRGCALGDFDSDGDLDIYLTAKRGYNLFFRNELNNDDWFEVEIAGDHTGAAGGLGTKIDLYAAGHLNDKAYLKGHREIQGEYGYLGQDMPAAHFGAPSAGGARYDLKVTFLDGTERVFTSLAPGQKILVASVSPPLNFAAAKVENKALFYRETLVELRWEPNPANSSVEKYKIYQADQSLTLLAEVSGSTFSYFVRDVSKTAAYRFAITAVDDRGNESPPAFTMTNGGTTQEERSRRLLRRNLKGQS